MNIGVDPDAVPKWHIVLSILGIMVGLMIPVILGVIMFSPILPLPVRQWTQKIGREDLTLHHTQGIEIQK
ncbi:MAG: hypothetical protein IPP22_10110 [Nitrosomonas sp.]|nr:hypothetical protein [Nitrosomonas sp.]